MARLRLFESLFGPSAATRRQRGLGGGRRRLSLQPLEDRRLLAVFTPAIFTDSNTPGAGSLRDAVIAADADTNASDTIQLGKGTYALTIQNLAGQQENLSQTGDLDIFSGRASKTLIIQGSGSGKTVIDASTLLDRVFHIINNNPDYVLNVQFRDLTITGGTALDDGAAGTAPFTPGGVSEGGGILNQGGNVILQDAAVTGNTAGGTSVTFESASGSATFANHSDARGGGIYSVGGSVTLADNKVVVSNNTALAGAGVDDASGGQGTGFTAQGGGMYATGGSLSIVAAQFTDNTAQGGAGGTGGGGQGGALFVDSSENVTAKQFQAVANTAQGGSGSPGIDGNGGAGGTGGNAEGGAVFNLGTSSFANTSFSADSAKGGAGGAGGAGGGNGGLTSAAGPGGNGGNGIGGAIDNKGSEFFIDSAFSSDTATGGAGGAGGAGGGNGGLTSAAGPGGDGGDAQGGAIDNEGSGFFTASSFTKDTARGGAGGAGGAGGGNGGLATMLGPGGNGGNAQGGAIDVATGSLSLRGSRVTGNQAIAGAGGSGTPTGSEGTAVGGGVHVEQGAVFIYSFTLIVGNIPTT